MGKGLVVILSDEHRADGMGCVGHPFVRTPNLDALAARGTVFSDAYTPSPICVPARAAFATGRHIHETGHWDNSMPYFGEPGSWMHVLQRGDIQVESIGKLHFRNVADPVGFDAMHLPMMVKDGVGMVSLSVRREEERKAPETRLLGDYIGPGESSYTKYDKAVVDRTERWFADRAAQCDGRPWCLYVGLVAPHFPLICPEPFFSHYREQELPEPKLLPRDGYARHPWVEKQNAFLDSENAFSSPKERKDAIAAYWGLVEWMDHNVGRILSALETSGLEADVIYASDHGDNAGARGLWGKSNFYREAVGVPLIASLSDMPTVRCSTPVSLLDLSCTIPCAFGLNWPGSRPGLPLQEVVRMSDGRDREIISQYHAAGAVSGAYMLRKGRWKYIEYAGFQPELFDLDTDPEESRNVAPEYPEIVDSFANALRKHVDPETAERAAFEAQDRLVEEQGGRENVLRRSDLGPTPPPD